MSFEAPFRTKASFGRKGAAKRTPLRAMRTAGERLAAAIFALGEGQGRIVVHSERPWASITFAGSRHTISLSFAGNAAIEAGERFIATLPDHEFNIPGQLVADAEVRSVEHVMLPEPKMRVEIGLLLLEDG